MNDRDDSVSETGSDHMITRGGLQDDVPRAESPIHGDHEYEISSTTSNPLEDSEYFDRCKVCLQLIILSLSCQWRVHVRGGRGCVGSWLVEVFLGLVLKTTDGSRAVLLFQAEMKCKHPGVR